MSSTQFAMDKEMKKREVGKEQNSSQNNDVCHMKNGIEQIVKNKKKKGRRDEEVGDFMGKKKTTAVEKVGSVMGDCDVDISGKVEKKKRKKEKKEGQDDLGGEKVEKKKGKKEDQDDLGGDKVEKKKRKKGKKEGQDDLGGKKVEKKKRKKGKKEGQDDLGGGVREMMAEELGKERSKIEDKDLGDSKENAELLRNKKQEMETKQGNKRKRKKYDSFETCPEDPKSKVKSKKVRFSGQVEVFPSSDGPSKGKEQNQEQGLVHGKRFTPEEDEKIKESVFNYIKARNLGEEGLHMVLHCGSYPIVRNCWKEIAAVFPNRPCHAIYYRAHSLFERGETRSWTAEEIELIRSHHEKHGAKWKHLAVVLGKNRVHLKDTWRRIKLPNKKRGHWSQDEYQSLFDLVNTDLQVRAFGEKKTKHGMLRDNISWTAISDKLSTRIPSGCCLKWYNQLSSPMVAEGTWADVDDYRMLGALFSLDACCIEDVDWDNLLDHRSGDICRKRWSQMVVHIGEHRNKSFAEQVEVLSERYCPYLLETKEAWDSKPVVD